MLDLQRWFSRRVQLVTVVLICSSWSIPAAAQGRREWALSLGPQLGYASIPNWFEGTVNEPGRVTVVDADGKLTAMTLGVSAALTKRFWFAGNQTGWGPIVSLSYAQSSNTRVALVAALPREQAALDRLGEELHPRFMRLLLQGGLGLTLLGGSFEGRFLFGGELVNTIIPEFTSASYEGDAALAASLGARLRVPVAETWLGYAGANCGVSKHPLGTGYSTSCTTELGLEWIIGR
jgi:hypothetical protein